MVRCAMCDSPATHHYDVPEYGKLSVCGNHYWVLIKKNDWIIKIEMQDILKGLINTLNEHYIKTESYMGMPPMKRGKYNGKREGLKVAISEIEKKLEELIRK